MKRYYYKCYRSFVIITSLLLFCYVAIFHHGLLLAIITYGTRSSGDNVLNKGFRKLLEEEYTLISEKTKNLSVSQRLPACIIVGARKCGTRALLEFLELHPQIVSPGDEMHFFSNDSNYKQGLDWYRKRMPFSTSDQITIEKTPRYFISDITPSRIHKLNSTIKLIIILRNPVTRVVSDYTQIYHNKIVRNELPEQFESLALDSKGRINLDYYAVQISMYHKHVSRWLEMFPKTQIHFVDGDNMIQHPIEEVAKVESFLNLPHKVTKQSLYFNESRGFFCMQKSKRQAERCLGVNKGRKHILLSNKTIHKLTRFFRPHNEQLFKIISHRFRWR